jgi:rod shape-determining protein MreC
MKKKFLQYFNKGGKIVRYFFLIILFIVTIFTFGLSAPYFSDIATSISLPIWMITKNEVVVYDINNTNIESLQILVQALKKENTELKELLGRSDIANRKTILATILVRPNQSPYDTIILDVGRNENIEINDKVLAQGDVVLGEIISVSDKTSKVRLFSSPGIETVVSVGEENITLTAIGNGGSNYIIESPREIEIKEGELITIAGPSIYILGVIGEIFSDPAESFKSILFKSPVNIQQLKWVFVEI